MKIFTGAVFVIIALLLWTVPAAYTTIKFDRDCGGYLERAAIASSVDSAVKELSVAINYLEKNNLTKGYTSVLYVTPDEDMGFFYNNLVSARHELVTLPASATQLEKTNTLMKLRETLTSSSDLLVAPAGISRFPDNGLFVFIVLLGFILVIAGALLLASGLEDL
jgi:hypothetical protein